MTNLLIFNCLTLFSVAAAASTEQEQQSGLITIPLIPYHVHVRRRRRLDRPAQENATISPKPIDPFEERSSSLYQGYGTHFVDLWIGTPFQRQSVIVDTGSGVTAVPCKNCVSCGSEYHTDPYFDEDASETFLEISCEECSVGHCMSHARKCHLEVSYQEGSSWTAHEVTDITYLGGSHEFPLESPPKDTFQLRFGCQSRVTGLFKTQLEDGIMGMDLSETSFWQQAYAQGVLRNKAFSLCFSRQKVVEIIASEAGVLTLGGNDPRLHSTSMVYADLVPHYSGYFQVHVKKIYLRSGGGESVESTSNSASIEHVDVTEKRLNKGGVIIDSGTTFTYLTEALAEPFNKIWKKLTGNEWDVEQAVHLSDEELLAMPTILIQLKGWTSGIQDEIAPGLAAGVDPKNPNDIIVTIPPTHYMEYSDKTRKYSPRVFFTEVEGGVLGANFMMGHNILFDEENKRLGFAESTCEYSRVADPESSQ
mmetsp:Transcript_6990/g.10214  ORF Transcript_6990/g.10214 Transcript_6990/m.10214 type:complete len:478 (+) Transcript_6990:146-1579(+)|eukprot:CAMPEP_0194214626 /NCGR_PEP_ID=MMETSP0156-20130528/15931_1 /TAXON_ID=33649 /ORGANISM="Thalassionema nitzschioides, Strain L26-B" /LENGTH=477 /DNA_ID=CAMNT_0038942927 /DNA_START=67 /DNA_END=1500 /DNA_ORIENTATION=-